MTDMNIKTTVQQTVHVLNDDGLHARPAGILAKKATQFRSEIAINRQGGSSKNAKSILSLLSLGAEKGDELTLTAQGEDAEAAVRALLELFHGGIPNA